MNKTELLESFERELGMVKASKQENDLDHLGIAYLKRVK